MNHSTIANSPDKSSSETSTDAAVLACRYEAEKACLARSIHDGLAQQLTVAHLELSLWEHELNDQGGITVEAVRARIAHLSELVGSMMGGARSVSAGLRPRTLDSFGFGAALEALVGKVGSALGIKCKFNEHGDGADLPADRSIHFYRIIEDVLGKIASAPKSGILVELRKKQSGAEVVIVAQPLPELPPEASARLRAFNGRMTRKDGVLTVSFPS